MDEPSEPPSPQERTLAAVRALSAGQRRRWKPPVVDAIELPFEIVEAESCSLRSHYPPDAETEQERGSMRWICMDCSKAKRLAKFLGPTNRSPKNGCPRCGSHQVLDLNVSPVKVAGLVDAPW